MNFRHIGAILLSTQWRQLERCRSSCRPRNGDIRTTRGRRNKGNCSLALQHAWRTQNKTIGDIDEVKWVEQPETPPGHARASWSQGAPECPPSSPDPAAHDAQPCREAAKAAFTLAPPVGTLERPRGSCNLPRTNASGIVIAPPCSPRRREDRQTLRG